MARRTTPPPASASVAEAAARLVDAIAAHVARADVQVLSRANDPGLSADVLADARARGMPEPLVELWSVSANLGLEWRFAEPPGCGCIALPRYRPELAFEHDVSFGDAYEALFLDASVPECSVYLVRPVGGRDTPVVFAAGGGMREVIARSLIDYLDALSRTLGVEWWPFPSPDTEAVLARLASKPRKVAPLRAGQRVDGDYYAEGGRGTVREVATASPPVDDRWLTSHGTEYALVRMDDGVDAWFPRGSLRVRGRTRDVYEEAFTGAGTFWAQLAERPVLERIERVALAIGAPVGEVDGYLMHATRRAAGILANVSVGEAVQLVATTFETAVKDVPTLRARHAMSSRTGASDPAFWKRNRWELVPVSILEGLCSGLAWKLATESAAAGVTPRQLVERTAIDRLRKVPGCSRVITLWQRDEVAAPPPRRFADAHQRAALRLPGDAPVGLGSGF